MTFLVSSRLHNSREGIRPGDAIGLWVITGSWCAEQDPVDGWVPDTVARHFAGRRWRRHARALVGARLWVEEGRAGEQGWRLVESDLWRFAVRVRKPIPDRLRARVLIRDGWRCLHCGSRDDLTLDHVWPWSLGGSDTFDNLQTLCRSCNSRKGARTDVPHPHHQA